jgi:plastocyanin
MQMTHTTRLVLITLTGALFGCGSTYGTGGSGGPPPPPAGNSVAATASLTFTPATLTVNAGETVTFAFGSVAHNVFFTAQAGAPADIAGTNANVSIDRQFTTAGSYAYTCHIHPSMHGTIVVN